MDYGYRLLRHVVQQVVGNLGAAARITLALIAVPALVVFLTNPALIEWAMQPIDPQAPEATPPIDQINSGGLLLGLVGSLIGWMWAAVAWHRFVLLEEYPTGILPPWSGQQIGNYFGNSVLIFLVLMGAALGFMLVIGTILALIPIAGLSILLGVGFAIAISWVALRFGLILPSAAIGEKMPLSESWRLTAPISGQLFLPLIVLAIGFGVINQLVTAAFGATILAAALALGVYWVQLLMNLALLTTLYGNLVEGRQLN